ncbi:MAG: hypothetical protein JXR70_14725 [Spirochaetales bacterium]|nr:hypothetical protein [Spirochaetales bacterium]
MLPKKNMFCLILFCAFSFSAYSQNWQDTNCDGIINIVDALIIAQFYVGIGPALSSCGNEVLPVSDPQLQLQLRQAIGKSGGILTIDDAKGIEEIDFDIYDFYTSMDYYVGLDYIDLKGLDSYPDLKKLSICAHKIFTSSVLADCEKLESLKLTSIDYMDDISIFEKLSSLKELKFDFLNPLISDYSFLIDYKYLTKLELLFDSYSSISFDYLQKVPMLPQVKQLSLDKHANLDFLNKFPNLESLTVVPRSNWDRNTNLTNLSFLKKVTKLIELTITKNAINDISALRWVPNLKKLDLEANTNIRDISPLQTVHYLTELRLSNARVENIEILSNMLCLQKLYLSGIAMNDIDFLSNLSSLEELDIANYDGSKGYSILFKLANLKKVIIAPKISDINLSNRGELVELASTGVIVASSDGNKLEVDINE